MIILRNMMVTNRLHNTSSQHHPFNFHRIPLCIFCYFVCLFRTPFKKFFPLLPALLPLWRKITHPVGHIGALQSMSFVVLFGFACFSPFATSVLTDLSKTKCLLTHVIIFVVSGDLSLTFCSYVTMLGSSASTYAKIFPFNRL